MNGSAPPAAPNFRQAATEQGQENLTAAQRQARLNNPNFQGIGGGQTITYSADGTPQVTQTLDANQQALYDQTTRNQLGAGNVANALLGQIGGGLDLNGLPARGATLDPNSLPAMPGDYGDVRQKVIDAMMGRSNTLLNQQGDQMNSDLIARGLRPGTEAYTREQDALNRQRNDAYQQAELAGGNAATQAIESDLARRGLAAGEQQQGFGQATTNRGMGLTEQQAAANLPMQQFATLMNGSRFQQPTLPGYQGNTQVAPAPIYGATTAASNYDTDVWNALMQQQNSRNAGLLSIGNTALNSPVVGGLVNRGIDYVGDNAGDWWTSLFG
jgi:hypothetical protein